MIGQAAIRIALAATAALAGCGGSPPRGGARERLTVVVGAPLAASVESASGDLELGRVIAVPEERSPADRAGERLERARELAVSWQTEAALAEVTEAQLLLVAEAATPADYDALHLALTYRALIESNLDRADRAEEALRAAARLRPDATLDAVIFPPDVREAYATLAAAARAEPPASVAVTTEPPGARVLLDGVEVGASPVTVSGSPGRHYLRVEAIGRAPRVLPIELGADAGRPLHVVLPPADAALVARQILALGERELRSLPEEARARIGRALDSEALLRAERQNGHARVVGLDLGLRRSADAEGEVESALRTVRSELDEDDRSAIRSPWLWTAIAAVLAGAGVGLGLVLRDTDPSLTVTE